MPRPPAAVLATIYFIVHMLQAKYVASALGVLIGFAYGFTSGSYQLFPFHQVAYLKNVVFASFFERPSTLVIAGARSVEVKETALQRLLVKRVPLPNGPQAFSGGGGFYPVGELLHVFDDIGNPMHFDLTNVTALESDLTPVPTNWDGLMRSRTRYEINIGWFRASGVFGLEEADGSHTIYVSHNYFEEHAGCVSFNVSRASVRRTETGLMTSAPWERIFTSEPCMYAEPAGVAKLPYSGHLSGGSMVRFDSDHLLLTVGDFAYDGYLREAWAQDLSNPYGKTILLNRHTGEWELYSWGQRNPMGLFRDTEGTIWTTEIGPQEGDVLRRIDHNTNYGWPLETYGINYESMPWPLSDNQGRILKHPEPHFAWVPGIVPSAIIRVEDKRGEFALWEGDLLLGSLKDQSLHRLRLDRDGRVVFDERIPFGERIRDVAQLPDGRIVLLGDGTGNLIFLGDGGGIFEEIDDRVINEVVSLEALDGLTERLAVVDSPVMDGATAFQRYCQSCHGLDGAMTLGPHLEGVLGRSAGSVPGFRYSEALRQAAWPWNEERLRDFLTDPLSTVPATIMPRIPLPEAQVDSIVAFLAGGAR